MTDPIIITMMLVTIAVTLGIGFHSYFEARTQQEYFAYRPEPEVGVPWPRDVLDRHERIRFRRWARTRLQHRHGQSVDDVCRCAGHPVLVHARGTQALRAFGPRCVHDSRRDPQTVRQSGGPIRDRRGDPVRHPRVPGSRFLPRRLCSIRYLRSASAGRLSSPLPSSRSIRWSAASSPGSAPRCFRA